VDIMNTNNANVLGVVLNNANSSLPYYYDYTHYHYDYSQTREPDNAPGESSNQNRRKSSGADSLRRAQNTGSSRDDKHPAH